jgi:hypothetical protein
MCTSSYAHINNFVKSRSEVDQSSPVFHRLLHVILLTALVACGGGGGGGVNPATNSTPTVGNSDPTNTGNSGNQPPLPTPDPLPPLTGLPGLTALPQTTLNFGAKDNMASMSPAPVISAKQDGRWNDAATWNLNRVPNADEVVSIPAGRSVQLDDATARVGGLWLAGTLKLANADGVLLNTKFAMITGLLEAGTPAQPITRNVAIELWGSDVTENIAAMGTKNLAVMSGGMLQLAGEPRLAWSKVNASANAGASSLTLKDDASSWRVGDQVVLASGSIDPRDAQVLTLTKVNGKQIEFSPPLAKQRYGQLQTFEGKELDQRPSVSLLTRKLRVRGAADSDVIGFGGHIMIMRGGHAQVSGVELQRMGQRGLPGRYPIHWHEAGDREGSYAIGNAINGGFQRAVVVHSTNKILVDANVAYNVPNHAFVWAEDGDEVANIFTRNVATLINTPEEKHFAFPINNPFFGNSSQGEGRSAAFWGRSMSKHILRDNISAGVLEGFGYFVDLFTPAPDSAVDGSGMTFDGNVAHSTFVTFVTGNQINYPEATRGHGLMVTTGANEGKQYYFQRYTGYQNVSGAWLEDRATVLSDSIVADNGSGVIVLRGIVDGVTVVGKSANTTPTPRIVASVSNDFQAAIQIAGSNHGGKRAPWLRKATIVNQPGVGILWDPDNIGPNAVIGDIKFVNTQQRMVASSPVIPFDFSEPPNYAFTDENGVILGNGIRSRVMLLDTTLNDDSCTNATAMAVIVCPASGSLMLQSNTSLTLAEANGRLALLRYWEMYDASFGDPGSASYVGAGRSYWANGVDVANNTLSLIFTDTAAKSVQIALPASASPSSISISGQSIAQMANLTQLRGSATSGYFFDTVAKQIYLRLVGTQYRHDVQIVAPFLRTATIGRTPEASTTSAADGYAYEVLATNATYQLRYNPNVTGTRKSIGVANNSIINAPSFLSGSTGGDTSVIKAYVYAPQDGIYRIGLWGSGGGTSVWLGDQFVMGEPWAYINSNYVRNNQLTTELQTWQPNRQVALRAGWHQVSVVHAKMPTNQEGNSLFLRWAAPSNPDTWVYPSIKVGL